MFLFFLALAERKGTWNERKKKTFERMSMGEEMGNFANFRPATLTVTNFFKQVGSCCYPCCAGAAAYLPFSAPPI